MASHNNVKLAQAELTQSENDCKAAAEVYASAKAALAHAVQDYQNSLSQGREAALAARHVQSDAEVDCDIAKHCAEQAEERVRLAREAASAAENKRRCFEANAAINKYHATLEREIMAMTSSARLIMRQWAEANIARNAAVNAGVLDDDLLSVDSIRNIDSLPKEILETKRVRRWINPWGGGPISEEDSKKVVISHGEAYLGQVRLREQAEFDLNVYLDYERGYRSGNIAEEISIPGLRANDIPGWVTPKFITPQSVIDQLDYLEGRTKINDDKSREKKVELVQVNQL